MAKKYVTLADLEDALKEFYDDLKKLIDKELDQLHDDLKKHHFSAVLDAIDYALHAEADDAREIKDALKEVLARLKRLSPPSPKPATRALIFFGPIRNKHTGVTVATILSTNQKVLGSVAFFDDAGNPAVVDGIPVWETDSPTIISVVAAADGMSAEVSALGPLGAAQVSMRADADLGSGSRELIALGDIEVVAAEAVSAVISFGAPEPK